MKRSLIVFEGLDPGGIWYDDLKAGLNSSCAQFVQVLHTDPGDFGTVLNRGNVDFWANNRTQLQPGCTDRPCGHFKALFYYFASLFRQYKFIGGNCAEPDYLLDSSFTSSDTSAFGLYNDGKTGQFCFETTPCLPYTVTPSM